MRIPGCRLLQALTLSIVLGPMPLIPLSCFLGSERGSAIPSSTSAADLNARALNTLLVREREPWM